MGSASPLHVRGMARLAPALVLLLAAAAGAAPLGSPGLSATYRLKGDPQDRPEYERENKLTVIELTTTIGPAENFLGRPHQWFEIGFAKLNGERFRLWLLLDRFPGEHGPNVARYVWSEPNWDRPLEDVHLKKGTALLPMMGLFSRGWPHGIKGVIEDGADFPEQVRYLGYLFDRAAVGTGANVKIPEPKVLRLNPDFILFTIDAFRYHGAMHWHMPAGENRFDKKYYTNLSADDIREMMDLGINLWQDNHRNPDRAGLDVWQEPVYVYDTSHPWPELLYRSNYYGWQWTLNEPAVHHSAAYVDQPQIVATWTPQQLAQSLLSKVESLMHTWRGFGTWRALEKNYGLGNLGKFQQRLMSWDQAPGSQWYQMLGRAWGIVTEGRPGVGVSYLNQCYQTEIPDTLHNSFALHVAVQRGAARCLKGRWGVSMYGYTDLKAQAAGLEYMYTHGVTDIWFWGGWPNVDADWPHHHKLFFWNRLKEVIDRHGPRDMNKLMRAAKVAIALPFGYEASVNGTMFDTWWMHPQRKNPQGIKIRRILHNAYTEAERLLRRRIEFDFVIDIRLDKDGYDEIVYIQEDGKVRVERGAAIELLDEPRRPERPELGPRPQISAEIVKAPTFTGDPVEIRVEAQMGSADVVRPASPGHGDYVGRDFALPFVFAPDGFMRPSGSVQVEQANPLKTVVSGTFRFTKTKAPGTYRVMLSTIDEFSRWSETWVEFEVRNRYIETPVTQFPTRWKFRLDREDAGLTANWFATDLDDGAWDSIDVPAWWEKAGIGDYDGVAWYRCAFEVPADAEGETLILAFGAVDGHALVFLNGEKIGAHDGDNALHWDKPFEFDVSSGLKYGEPNRLAVRVKDTEKLGGIFKPVRLIARKPAP